MKPSIGARFREGDKVLSTNTRVRLFRRDKEVYRHCCSSNAQNQVVIGQGGRMGDAPSQAGMYFVRDISSLTLT